jgi:hypothetical protein
VGLVCCTALVIGLSGCSVSNAADDAFDAVAEYENVYLAIPHPDDEFQDWGLIENSDQFKVFVLMTRGEATGFCRPEGLSAGYQEGLELAPSPVPTAQFGPDCVDARLNSILGFLQQMSNTDQTIPGDFNDPITVSGIADPESVVCSRMVETRCVSSNTTAEVWTDRRGRGVLIAFDLGDGNLTVDEVVWALNAVRSAPESFGIDANRPNGFVASAYANDRNPFCFSYPHPDHLAVAAAVRDVDLALGPQFIAACGFPWESQLRLRVSDESADAAFEFRSPAEASGAVRRGAHEVHYGWLDNSVYPLDRNGQNELFMQNQTFVLTKQP